MCLSDPNAATYRYRVVGGSPDPLMGCIKVLQSSISGSARAVLARVEMRSPMMRSYFLGGASVAMFEGA